MGLYKGWAYTGDGLIQGVGLYTGGRIHQLKIMVGTIFFRLAKKKKRGAAKRGNLAMKYR